MHEMSLAIGLGGPELLVILAIVVLVFGAGKIPQLGDALGKGITNFKKSLSGQDEIDISAKSAETLRDGGSADGSGAPSDASPASSETRGASSKPPADKG